MNDQRPGIEFEDGVCLPCIRSEERKSIDWNEREKKLKSILNKYRKTDGSYDCLIPASGGKDSYFQVMKMKQLGMHPLVVKVCDSFSPTEVGEYNLYNMSDVFNVDILTYNLNHNTCRKMTRIAFEEFGSPNYPIDLAIYSVPLKIAHSLNIPLIVYGENIAYEYGGPDAKETYSAKEQIKNDVVKPIDKKWWNKRGVTSEEFSFATYPNKKIVDSLEPIYLSYFFEWDGRKNYEVSKTFGFRSLESEWERKGFIEQYDQIDSVGYLVHPWLKYPKYGHARATDVACNWIRNGYITRDYAIKLVKENDHKLDTIALSDFLAFTGYSRKEFYKILDTIYNPELFEKRNEYWHPRFVVQ